MKYMITFPLTKEGYAERVARFLETGAPPPEGVTMLGRWFTLAHSYGYILVESDQPKELFAFASEWAHLVDFNIEPVIGDEEAAEVLTRDA